MNEVKVTKDRVNHHTRLRNGYRQKYYFRINESTHESFITNNPGAHVKINVLNYSWPGWLYLLALLRSSCQTMFLGIAIRHHLTTFTLNSIISAAKFSAVASAAIPI